MNEVKKFTEQELAEIRMLQGKFQEKIFEFGNFRIERMGLLKLVRDLEDREAKAETDFLNLQKMEEELLDKLTKKYGEGALNLNDGTFTPAVVTQKENTTL
jgi:hypothetical protein